MVEWTRPVKSLRPLGSGRQCLGLHVTSRDRARATPERIRRARGRSMLSGHPAACRLAKPRADRDAKEESAWIERGSIVRVHVQECHGDATLGRGRNQVVDLDLWIETQQCEVGSQRVIKRS